MDVFNASEYEMADEREAREISWDEHVSMEEATRRQRQRAEDRRWPDMQVD